MTTGDYFSDAVLCKRCLSPSFHSKSVLCSDSSISSCRTTENVIIGEDVICFVGDKQIERMMNMRRRRRTEDK